MDGSVWTGSGISASLTRAGVARIGSGAGPVVRLDARQRSGRDRVSLALRIPDVVEPGEGRAGGQPGRVVAWGWERRSHRDRTAPRHAAVARPEERVRTH